MIKRKKNRLKMSRKKNKKKKLKSENRLENYVVTMLLVFFDFLFVHLKKIFKNFESSVFFPVFKLSKCERYCVKTLPFEEILIALRHLPLKSKC